MSARALVFVVIALLMAGATALIARNWLSSERAEQSAQATPVPQAITKNVLVAVTDLPAGSFIKAEHVRWQSWPEDAVNGTYLIEGVAKPEDVVGSVVRRGIVGGEPVTSGRIVRPGDRGFLAAVLQPGMRAVAIGVNPTSGIAGLVFPGDRVDIILTQSIPTGGSEPRLASETVLENVRVLAIDQILNDQSGEPTLGKNATIEVTPKQAEVVAVVSDMGKLSLSLRSLARPETGEDALDPVETVDSSPEPWRGETYTWDSDASLVLAGRRAPRGGGGGHKVLVFQGGKAESVNLGGGQ
ncbi:MAG TPA: Flp pilus assembly protein CpaB [Alphaproteobacteria bacterium]|nr:Flp pilus assembly protein CpaB [Alphaproteobacteria bacterium]